ncbi:MAG: hypothetical protein IJM59_13825, partial [Proteobacteria bacterium]|nr:hypothetical protein [Pseudomonadota bacterium]
MKKFQILSCIAAALLLFGCDDDSSSSKTDCTAEQTKCEDNVLYTCVDGQFDEGTPCGTNQTCGEDPANPGVFKCLGSGTSDLCTENKTSCDGKKLITCVTGKAKETKECPVKCGADPDNAGAFKCLEDEQPTLCTENSTSCGENNSLVTCVKDQEPVSDPCGDDKTCGADPDNAGAYKCLDNAQVDDCTEDKTSCDGNTLITCVIGQKQQTVVCNENQTCGEDADNPGTFKCNDNQTQPTCTEGETKCAENNTLVTCASGNENSESCGDDKTCGLDPDNAGKYICLDNAQIEDCTEDKTSCDESNNLITCVIGKKPATVACGDKTCGADPDNEGAFKCNDTQPQPTCTEGETKCDDQNNLLTCEGGTAKSTFCGSDKTCGPDPDKEGAFACIENAQIEDCTEDKTECKNNSLITCEKGKKPVTVDCGDKTCGEDPDKEGAFACIENAQIEDCTENKTECKNNSLITCEKGKKPVTVDCGDKTCGEDPEHQGTFVCLDKAPEKLCEADGTSCDGNNLVTCIKGQKPLSKPCGDKLTCGENPKAPGTYACLDTQGKTCEKDYTKCDDNITLITCIKGEKPATTYCNKNQACEEDPKKPGTYACVDKLIPACTEGATRCEEDNTLVTCINGKEESTGCGKKTCAENPEKPGTYACIIITDVCKEDYTKCDDKNNLIICKKGEKEITLSCGDQICGEDPKNPNTFACLDAPKCKNGETKCVDKTLYTCKNGAFDEGKLCTAICGLTNKNQYACLPYTKIVDINNDYKRLVAEKCDGTSAMAAHDYDITGIITGIRADKKGFFIQDTSDSTNAHSGILVDYDVENCPKDKLKIAVGSAYKVSGTGIGHTDCQIMLGHYSLIPLQCQVKVEVSNVDISVKPTIVDFSKIGTTPNGDYNGSLVTVDKVSIGKPITDPKGYEVNDLIGKGYIDNYLSILPAFGLNAKPRSFTGVVHYTSKKSVLSPIIEGGAEQNADQCKEGSYACDGTTLLECVKDGNLQWKKIADCSKT